MYVTLFSPRGYPVQWTDGVMRCVDCDTDALTDLYTEWGRYSDDKS